MIPKWKIALHLALQIIGWSLAVALIMTILGCFSGEKCFGKSSIALPPEPDKVMDIKCHVSHSEKKPGLMPAWIVTITAVYRITEKVWTRNVNQFPDDKLKDACAYCSEYLKEFNKFVKGKGP